jgi:hypothetical protein
MELFFRCEKCKHVWQPPGAYFIDSDWDFIQKEPCPKCGHK